MITSHKTIESTLCEASIVMNKRPALRQAHLQANDILRLAAPRRLRKLNIHVHDILAVMTGEHLAHYYYTQIALK